MTIMLDPRSGSGEVLPYFKPYDVPVDDSVQLDAGDFAFVGNGPNGDTPLIGFERKVLTDAISSMRTERFMGEQLPKLLAMYPMSITIIVEGIFRAGPQSGSIEVKARGGDWFSVRVGPRSVMYRELDHWLATIEEKLSYETGRQFRVVRTSDPAQTAAYVVSRYKWWNDKEWDEHDSYKVIYSPDVPNPSNLRRSGFSLPQPGPVEEVACRFPGVREKAWNFGKVFDNVVDMVNADPKRLEEVEGIGKKLATRTYEWLRRRTPRAGESNVGRVPHDDWAG